MHFAPRLRAAAVLVSLMLSHGAVAQTAGTAPAPSMPPVAEVAPPSEEGAAAIAAAVRDWLSANLGNSVDAAALPLRVMPDGEAYRMELGLGGSYFDDTVMLGEGALAARVKPLDGGRWAILGADFPGTMRAELRNPADGAPSTLVVGIERQETTGTFDPTLATTSVFTTTVGGYSTELRSAAGVQSSRIEKLTGRSEWQPAGPGLVTVLGDSEVQGYATSSPMPGGGTMTMSIDRMTSASRIENFDVAKLGELLRTAYALGATAMPAGKPGTALGKDSAQGKGSGKAADTQQEKALARTLLTQLFAMLDAIETKQSYSGITVEGGPLFAGSLRKLDFGLALGAPAGQTGFKLHLALEGLETDLIPEGAWREVVPHRVALTPKVSGIPKEALKDYLRRAIDSEGANIEAETMQLLAANPVVVGVDDLLVDLGPMRLTGGGIVELVNAVEATGRAELRATGLDALIRRVNAAKELKMAAPALIFMKGIGRQVGAETVWTITYANNKVMVNDTDMSDMVPLR